MELKTAFPKKTLICLVCAQAVCLAFGLWIQDRLLLFSWRDTAPSHVGAGLLESPTETSARDREPQQASAAEIAEALHLSRWIAFAWIAGLQTTVAYLVLSRMHVQNADERTRAGAQSMLREKDLERTQNAVIFGLAKLAESRDPETGRHLERIAHYATRFSQSLRRMPRYREQVTPAFVRLIGISSALHDIGKVGVEDHVLLKPGKLDAEERLRMELHAVLGGKCIHEIEQQLGASNFLQMAREIAFYHHERWDGQGYPTGLSGDAIPLSARIVAIADVYDALSMRRIYKPAIGHDQCVAIIRSEAGKHFDPDLVEVFLSIEQDFCEIARQLGDPLSHIKPLQPHTEQEDQIKNEIDELCGALQEQAAAEHAAI